MSSSTVGGACVEATHEAVRPRSAEVRPVTNSGFHLAQVNIGRARGEMTDPVMAEFVARLPDINALAERSPGFVWRLQTEDGDATAVRPYADTRILINLSVWTDLDTLRAYVYRSDHAAVMKRRREWFERFDRIYVALWWLPIGPFGRRGGCSPRPPGAARTFALRLQLRPAVRGRRAAHGAPGDRA
jgi:hypothetical protein